MDLQGQITDLRSDLLDEREKRIGRWQESNGTALVVLGIVIGIGGLWAYAKFRAIAVAAGTGMAAKRDHPFSLYDGSRSLGRIRCRPDSEPTSLIFDNLIFELR